LDAGFSIVVAVDTHDKSDAERIAMAAVFLTGTPPSQVVVMGRNDIRVNGWQQPSGELKVF
jgi:hypothetical protein